MKALALLCALLLAIGSLAAWIVRRQEYQLSVQYQGRSYNLSQTDLPRLLAILSESGLPQVLESHGFIKLQPTQVRFFVGDKEVKQEEVVQEWIAAQLPQYQQKITPRRYTPGNPHFLFESPEALPHTPGLSFDPATHSLSNLKLDAFARELKQALSIPQTISAGELGKLSENNRVLVRDGDKLKLYRLGSPQTRTISAENQDEFLYDWIYKKYRNPKPGRPHIGKYTITRKRWDGNETTTGQIKSVLLGYLRAQGVDDSTVKDSDISIDKRSDPDNAIITVRLHARTITTRTRLADEIDLKDSRFEFAGKLYPLSLQGMYDKLLYRIEIRERL